MNELPRMPPRYVPVLTEIAGADARVEPVPVAAPAPTPIPAPAGTQALEDQLIHRVMQRVDVALERDLHEAVTSMVLQHTHALVPRLREEIEFVVRQAVSDAVAAELAQRPTA